MPFDATVTFADGSSHVYKGVPDGTAPEDVSAQAQKEFGKPVKSLDGGEATSSPGGVGKEILRVGAKAVQGGLTAFPGFLGDSAAWLGREFLANPPGVPKEAIQKAYGDDPLYQHTNDFKFGDVGKALRTAGGNIPEAQPQTSIGKRVAGALEGAISGVTVPGNTVYNMLQGLSAGTGSEAAGALTEDNPIAKVVGALLGAGGFAGVSRLARPNSNELIQDATSHVDPKDWLKAQERATIQQNAGIPALASQNVPNSTLPDMVSQAALNPRVGPALKKAVAGSQDNAADSMNAWTRQNLPLGKGMDQTDVLNETQLLAEKALSKARDRAGSAYGAKVPDLVNETEMPADKFKAMTNELEQFINRADVGPNSDAGKAVRKFIDTKLNTAVEGEVAPATAMQRDMNKNSFVPRPSARNTYQPDNMRDVEDAFEKGRPVWIAHEMDEKPFLATSREELQNYSLDQMLLLRPEAIAANSSKFAVAGKAAEPAADTSVRLMGNLNQFYKELNQLGKADDFRGLPVTAVRAIMKKYTPEYDAARQAWRSSMENDYAVSSQGLTGDLANYKGGQSWDKSSVSPELLTKLFGPGRDNTVQLNRLAGDIGDEQVGALLREHIGRVLGSTIKDTKSGAATLQTPADFTSALAGSPSAKKNIETALGISAKAQGLDPAATSQGFWKLMDTLNTTKNLRLPDIVDPGVMADVAGKNIGSTMIAPRLSLNRLFRVRASTQTYQEIANIVTSPDGLKQLQQIAGEKDPQRLRQAAIAVLMQADRIGKDSANQGEERPRIMVP